MTKDGIPSVMHSVIKVDENGSVQGEDLIVRESALTIYVNGEELATVVCSPTYLEYMAVGFLCSEGVLRRPEDLKRIEIDEEQGTARVETAGQTNKLAEKVFLKRYITPCCGRSRASFYFATDAILCRPVTADLKITAATVRSLAASLEQSSQLFQRTGGVHNAALASGESLLIFQEDIGRHNALDKIMGQCFLEGIPQDDKSIVFSGRVSSEIILKIVKMGIPVLISRSAPTDLALALADDLGVTVVGFAREHRCNIYTHPERIILQSL